MEYIPVDMVIFGVMIAIAAHRHNRELDRQARFERSLCRASRRWIEERERREFISRVRREIDAASERKSA